MRILILNAVEGWSGIGSHTLELALALTRRGHHPIIGCSHEVNITYYAEKYNLPIKGIKLKNSVDIRGILKMIKVALKEDVKVIVTNLGKEYWPAAFVAKLLGLKIIVVRHQTNRLKKITCWLLARHVDRVVAVSHAVKDVLIADEIPPEKIDVIYNAINLERFNPFTVNRAEVREELRINRNDIVIGTAGRLCREKGGLELLHAMQSLIKKNSSVKLMFVGDGPYRAKLENEAKELSMTREVIFTGFRNDMNRIYAAMDIFVLPSICKEAFGIALIEAMAMIKPVIATAVGGVPEIINNEINGFLIQEGNHSALTDAIDRLINNADLSNRIGLQGRKTVERNFSEKALGNGFERVFNKVVH